MGTMVDPVDGIMIPDPRFVDSAYIAVNDGSALGSSYTQATPRPGMAVPDGAGSRLAPRITGGLGSALNIRPVRGGHPGTVELAYRVDGEADTDWRGWNPPNVLTGWIPPLWTTTKTYSSYDACVIPSTGQVVVVAKDPGTTVDAVTYVWDPSDWAWTLAAGSFGGSDTMSVLCLPGSERLLALDGLARTVYYSDDVGATWSAYTTDCFADVVSAISSGWGRSRWAYLRGDILLLVESGAGSPTYEQLVSTDLGATFSSVATLTSIGTSLSLAVSGGAAVLGYRRDADGYPCVRVATSAGVSLAGAATIVIDAALCAEVAISADPSGQITAYVRTGGVIAVHLSDDGGQTWAQYERGLSDTGSAADYPTNLTSVNSAGYTLLMHNWVASIGNEDGSLGVQVCGGWSNVPMSPHTLNTSHDYTLRTGFGPDSTGAGSGAATWIPIERPEDGPLWTKSGAGVSTLVAPGRLKMTADATNSNAYNRATTAEMRNVLAFQMQCVSGGNLASLDVGVLFYVADSSSEYKAEIRFSTTGFRVVDSNTTTQVGSDVAIDLTSDLQFLVYWIGTAALAQNIQVFYRRPNTAKWTVGPAGKLVGNFATPKANGGIQWGNLLATVSESRWSYFHYAMYGNLSNNIGSMHGMKISSDPTGLPDAAAAGARIAQLSALAGPGMINETWSVTPRYDYPLSATISTVAPSPSKGWRSTSTAEQILTWDLVERSQIGNSVGLLVKSANYRTAHLEYYDGSAWVTAGTYDGATDFSGMGYVLTGDSLTPSATTAAGGRYLWEDELAGGHVILDTGGTPKARRIASNTAGSWVSSTGTARPTIYLDGIDGTEVATGTCDIVSPSGVLVVHFTAPQRWRYWRYRIPAAQTVAESYYATGIATPLRLVAYGSESSWGQGVEYRGNVSESISRAGTSYVAELGPVASSWTLGFTPSPQIAIRGGSDLAYRGVNVGGALATLEDIGHLLKGVLEATRSGEVPVVGVAQIPLATTTITDPTLYLYGRMKGPITLAVEVGTIGASEVLRVDTISIDEIV